MKVNKNYFSLNCNGYGENVFGIFSKGSMLMDVKPKYFSLYREGGRRVASKPIFSMLLFILENASY